MLQEIEEEKDRKREGGWRGKLDIYFVKYYMYCI